MLNRFDGGGEGTADSTGIVLVADYETLHRVAARHNGAPFVTDDEHDPCRANRICGLYGAPYQWHAIKFRELFGRAESRSSARSEHDCKYSAWRCS
jgi:hypothetical protein